MLQVVHLMLSVLDRFCIVNPAVEQIVSPGELQRFVYEVIPTSCLLVVPSSGKFVWVLPTMFPRPTLTRTL